MLSCVDDFLYWYASEEIGKWFVDKLGKILILNFLVYAHWFIFIRISLLSDYSTSVYQDRYATYIVAKNSIHFYNKIKFKVLNYHLTSLYYIH